jgi:hypothetical protein
MREHGTQSKSNPDQRRLKDLGREGEIDAAAKPTHGGALRASREDFGRKPEAPRQPAAEKKRGWRRAATQTKPVALFREEEPSVPVEEARSANPSERRCWDLARGGGTET